MHSAKHHFIFILDAHQWDTDVSPTRIPSPRISPSLNFDPLKNSKKHELLYQSFHQSQSRQIRQFGNCQRRKVSAKVKKAMLFCHLIPRRRNGTTLHTGKRLFTLNNVIQEGSWCIFPKGSRVLFESFELFLSNPAN